MHCFEHNSVPAVGSCKACHKGLCSECAVDLERGLACSGNCETDVAELAEMNERSKRIYGIGKYKTKMPASGVLLWGTVSIAFWAIIGFIFFRTGEFSLETAIPAVLFTLVTAFAYYSSRRTGINC